MNLAAVASSSSGVGSINPTSLQSKVEGALKSSGLTQSNSDSVTISSPAQFFSKLEDLSQNNPTQLKEALGKVANSLQSAASSSSGTEKDILTDMASRFQQASQSGDISGLYPPKPQSALANAYALGNANSDPLSNLLKQLDQKNSSDTNNQNSNLQQLLQSFVNQVNSLSDSSSV